MEKTEEMRKKQKAAQNPSKRRGAPANVVVKLAAIAIALNVRLRSSDMPPSMQDHALRYTRSLLDAGTDAAARPNMTHAAQALKKEFDSEYGPAWHCVAGVVRDSLAGRVRLLLDRLGLRSTGGRTTSMRVASVLAPSDRYHGRLDQLITSQLIPRTQKLTIQ